MSKTVKIDMEVLKVAVGYHIGGTSQAELIHKGVAERTGRDGYRLTREAQYDVYHQLLKLVEQQLQDKGSE
tara:strand:+ start:758 stop:970 length:213 start_codon:yes stop_codon:yes gene_type:complete